MPRPRQWIAKATAFTLHQTIARRDGRIVRYLDLKDAFAALQDLEVETYTFGVLPPAYCEAGVADAVARELAWVRSRLTGTGGAGG